MASYMYNTVVFTVRVSSSLQHNTKEHSLTIRALVMHRMSDVLASKKVNLYDNRSTQISPICNNAF